MAKIPEGILPAVNVWDADTYGNGRHSGTRWTMYPDSEDGVVNLDIILARGQVPEGDFHYGSDDDWLYGEDARLFLATATIDEEV